MKGKFWKLCPQLLDIHSMLSGGFKDAFRTPEKLTAVHGCTELIDRFPRRREVLGLRCCGEIRVLPL